MFDDDDDSDDDKVDISHSFVDDRRPFDISPLSVLFFFSRLFSDERSVLHIAFFCPAERKTISR